MSELSPTKDLSLTEPVSLITPAPTMIDALKALSTALGLAGVLAVAGYVSIFARDEFLGVHIGLHSPADLTYAAGQFLVSTVLISLEQLIDHPLKAAVVFVGLLLILEIGPRLYPRIFKRSLFRYSIAGLLVAMIALNLIWYALPTIKLRNSLIVGLQTQMFELRGKNFMNCRARSFLVLMVNSRSTKSKTLTDLDDPGCAPNYSKVQARQLIESSYASCVFACVIAWWIIFFGSRSGLFLPFGSLLQISCLILTLTLTMFLPYVFAKLVDPTPTVLVTISFKAEGKEAQTPAEKSLLLASESEGQITVFQVTDGIAELIEIPRERISEIKAAKPQDVFASVIDFETPIPPPPGGP